MKTTSLIALIIAAWILFWLTLAGVIAHFVIKFW